MLDFLILKQIFILLYNTEGNANHKMNMNTSTSSYSPPAHLKQSLGQQCTYTPHERVLSTTATYVRTYSTFQLMNLPLHSPFWTATCNGSAI